MQHDTLCNVELRRAIILQSILYWALHSTSGPAVQGPNTGKGINRGCMVEWELKCKFKAQCKATEGTQK